MNLRQIQDIAGHRDVPPWVIKLVQDCIEHNRMYEREQPQGEWVDLTDEEIKRVIHSCFTHTLEEFANAVIAKFKEKNTPPVVQQEPVGFVRIDKNGDCELHGHTLWQLGSGDYDVYLAPPSVEAEKEKQNV